MSKHDIDFMPETYAAEIETLPFTAHAILWSSATFLVVAIIWANFASIDEVTHAEGRVIPSSQLQVIQNLEGGILAEILVKEGEKISQGQSLIRLDDTRFASLYGEGQLTTLALTARIARLEAEISDKEFIIPSNFPNGQMGLIESEKSLFRAKKSELQSAISVFEQQLNQNRQTLIELETENRKLALNANLARRELELTKPLVTTGAVSQVELLRLEIGVNDTIGRLNINKLNIPKAESVIKQTLNQIFERRQQFALAAQAELNEARTELTRLSFSNITLEDRVKRTIVKSPVDGTVKQLLINTVGAVIQPGMDLLEIVPSNDTLLIEAKIRPADIAFLRPGQKATVKLSAYDFAIYGGLDSVLEFISADTITDERGDYYFQIRVRTQKAYLGSDSNPFPIIPGMVATVNIMTGQKTIMNYLLKPLKRAQANALRER
ncbi:MAG: HlyD family type I secretion periplasmic adaptor subunit [Pseudomonadales bacterium]|nr:HlyD family type I secretion periplasmic adaptor subunit [Pseudomonadales bacterium]